jgi:hypothetical protein
MALAAASDGRKRAGYITGMSLAADGGSVKGVY